MKKPLPELAAGEVFRASAPKLGRRWLDEIMTGLIIDAGQLARRERCTVRQINLTLSLAFLATQLVKAAVEGCLPRGINIERLRDPVKIPTLLWLLCFQVPESAFCYSIVAIGSDMSRSLRPNESAQDQCDSAGYTNCLHKQ